MPGRFTSDTNSRCLLVSRSIWTTTMVDTCYPVAVLTGTASVLGIASFSSSGGTFAAAAPSAADGIILNQTVASGIDNVLTFDVAELEESDEEGVLVTVLETIDNVPYVIGGGRLRQGKDQRITFRATGNNIQVVLNGPYTNLVLAQVCTRYARSTAQTYLVEVCDESKDRYRFGFNGQEKVNEIAGVGNHNTAEFWEYDTRLGRRWEIDPVDYPWQSGYAVFDNMPILKSDPLGLYGTVKEANEMRNKAIAAGYNVGDTYACGDSYLFNYSRSSTNEAATANHKTNFEKSVSEISNANGISSGNSFGGQGLNVWQAARAEGRSKEELNSAKSQTFSKAAKEGYLPSRIEFKRVEAEGYFSATLKTTINIPNSNFKYVMPNGFQAVASTQSSGVDIIDPLNGSYLNYKVSKYLDARVMPFTGITRGDWSPGARTLITVRNAGPAKIQADLGLNKSLLSIGARGVVETPNTIFGATIPYSAEASAGLRLRLIFEIK